MKLSSLTIYLVGLFLFIPIVAFGYFMYWVPNTTEVEYNKEVLEKLKTESAKLNKAKKRQQEAITMVEQATGNWQRVVADRTPPKGLDKGGIDLSVNAYQLGVDTRKFRNNVQRALNKQLLSGGITVVNAPYVPDLDVNAAANSILASYYNFGPLPFPVVIYDLGNVTVQGTYKQITDNVRAWARMPHYLAVADGLRIDGTSPNLTGSYNLTLVGYIRGNVISPAVKEAAVSTTGGGFGGGGAFGGGGFPGPGAGTSGPSLATAGAAPGGGGGGR